MMIRIVINNLTNDAIKPITFEINNEDSLL